MKKLISLILAFSLSSYAMACEFTSLKAKVKVESRTLDYSSHKEKIQTVGSLSGSFVKNDSGYKVFRAGKENYELDSLTIAEKYDYYTTTVRTTAVLSGETVVNILKEAIGQRKLARNANLQGFLALIDPTSSIQLYSSFYAFHGSYYGETDDETEDGFELVDPSNKDNKLLVTFNFKRKTRCN